MCTSVGQTIPNSRPNIFNEFKAFGINVNHCNLTPIFHIVFGADINLSVRSDHTLDLTNVRT